MAFFQTDNLWVNQQADGVADLVLDVPGSKVNLLNRQVLLDLEKALERVEADSSFQIMVLRSGKGASFCAGLDPHFLAELKAEDFADLADLGQRVCGKLAESRLPSVAVLGGTCLSGGLELALACDYRIVIDKPGTQIGFPDLERGLIPFWGGTQRLPRVVGLERSLHMLLGGRRLGPREARVWGLADELNQEKDSGPPAFLQYPQKRFLRSLPLRSLRQKLLESNRLGRWLLFRGAERRLRKRLPDDMPAPWQALEALRVGLMRGLEAGLAKERAAATVLAGSEAFGNLLRLHVQRDKFRLTYARDNPRPPFAWRGGQGGPSSVREGDRIRKIGVVGGGSRGSALISMTVSRGCQVVVRESNEAALGIAMFRMLTMFQQEVARGAMTPGDMMKNLGNIRGTTAWKGFDEVDAVLEAIDEDTAKKQTLFQELEKNTPAQTLLISTSPANTVSELQEGLRNPERVAALHFLPPPGRSVLVEVAASEKTDPHITRRLIDFVVALGRMPLEVKDRPGFLVQRLLFPYFNEAILLVKEGLDPRRLDEALVRFGMIDGPLEYLDLMGLDVAAALAQALAPVLGTRIPLDGTPPWMVGQKWLGQKTGLGFYRYRGRRHKVNQALVSILRAESHAGAPYRMEALSVADQMKFARRRLVPLMVNEAAWCLEEGLVDSPESLDLALALAGWAPHRGGPIHYARHLGIDNVIRELAELADKHGPGYEACPGWRRKIV